jgi:lipopolysaccharide export LptBFGC system permease protein LptF
LPLDHTMRKRLPVIIAYLALLALSLPVPLLHHYQTDKVVESLRPVIRLDDGTYSPTLLPVTTLFLRWLGQLSWWVTVFVFVFFALSFWRERFTRFTTIGTLAICQCAFTTFYALYATFFLGVELLH